jgi:hypothetical protein
MARPGGLGCRRLSGRSGEVDRCGSGLLPGSGSLWAFPGLAPGAVLGAHVTYEYADPQILGARRCSMPEAIGMLSLSVTSSRAVYAPQADLGGRGLAADVDAGPRSGHCAPVRAGQVQAESLPGRFGGQEAFPRGCWQPARPRPAHRPAVRCGLRWARTIIGVMLRNVSAGAASHRAA